MKRWTWILILSMSWLIGSCAPAESTTSEAPAAPTESDADVEATILGLEQQWVDAIVNKDTAALDRLLADDFVGTSPTGFYYYKDTAIDDLAQGTLDVTSMDLDEASVNVYGDTAVTFTSQEEVSTYAGEDTSGHYRYTNVWIRRDGEWHVVASHGSRFDQPD